MVMIIKGKEKYLLLLFLLIGIFGCSGIKDVPEMKEVIDQFTDLSKRAAVLQKYGVPGVVPHELTLCAMTKPVVTKTEEKEGIVYYTLESTIEKCEYSPKSVGTVRIFTMGWKNQRIVSFVWGGPKGGKVEY